MPNISPIIITGFFGSGVDIVAEALHRAGVYLGKNDSQYGAITDWELAMGGLFVTRISNMPLFESEKHNVSKKWVYGRGFDSKNAVVEWGWKILLKNMELEAAGRVWGWRSRRGMLQIPFFQKLAPTARYIICMRDPENAASSVVRQRPDVSRENAVKAWYSSHRVAQKELRAAKKEFLLVDYNSLLSNPQKEVYRALKYIGLEYTDNVVEHIRTKKLETVPPVSGIKKWFVENSA